LSSAVNKGSARGSESLVKRGGESEVKFAINLLDYLKPVAAVRAGGDSTTPNPLAKGKISRRALADDQPLTFEDVVVTDTLSTIAAGEGWSWKDVYLLFLGGIDGGFRAMRGMATTNAGINKYSKNITQPKSQGASQAMRICPSVNCVDEVVYATGLTEEDMSKAQVGISRSPSP